jgi:hypothetical protein
LIRFHVNGGGQMIYWDLIDHEAARAGASPRRQRARSFGAGPERCAESLSE